jgi:hypothetical protein
MHLITLGSVNTENVARSISGYEAPSAAEMADYIYNFFNRK